VKVGNISAGTKTKIDARAWSFLAICHTVGLCPSAQSALDPGDVRGAVDESESHRPTDTRESRMT
jgi:hypothetical protein